MSGPAVTIVAEGGVPVTPVEGGAPVLSSVQSGGSPITLTADATPFVIEGYSPNPPAMGPLDFASHQLGVFDSFSKEYDLASDSAIMGLVAHYTGDPSLQIAHGGEPLTILHMEKGNGIMSVIAAGTGLTTETADLTIVSNGGSVGGGAFRINEMVNVEPALSGWTGGARNAAASLASPPMSGTSGGVSKIAFGSTVFDARHATTLEGASIVWNGYLVTGEDSGADLSPDGPWILGGNWNWDDQTLKHTGDQTTSRCEVIGLPTGLTAARVYVKMADRTRFTLSIFGAGVMYIGPYEGYIYDTVNGSASQLTLTAMGDVEVSEMSVIVNGHNVTWVFGGAPAENGAVYRGVTTARGPYNAISVAEILGEDY